MKTGTYRVTS